MRQHGQRPCSEVSARPSMRITTTTRRTGGASWYGGEGLRAPPPTDCVAGKVEPRRPDVAETTGRWTP